MAKADPYESWTREELITRLRELETKEKLKEEAKPAAWRKGKKPFDFASQPRRKIALRFFYSGWLYNGLAIQDQPTRLPTVEGVLFNALATVRLIDRAAGMEGCGWERCGRTDIGVSGAGQVISLWVRSALKEFSNSVASSEPRVSTADAPEEVDEHGEFSIAESSNASVELKPVVKELSYIRLLNNVLPPSIRVMAWSPVSSEFSARFSCKYRHYKYFFATEGLDVARMQDAASRLLGEHDFRNLCKLDPTKQIKDFRRKILRADISRISSISSFAPDSQTDIYVFDLIGTAFLYHQVRHIMAILFLVGTGLEPPSIVSALANANANAPYPPQRPDEPPPEVVTAKPVYQMADGLPLVLWDCAFHETDVQWQTADDASSPKADTQARAHDLAHEVHSVHSRTLIQATMEDHLYRSVSQYHTSNPSPLPLVRRHADGDASAAVPPTKAEVHKLGLLRIPLGAGTFVRTGQYTPLLQRKRLEPVEIVNERWRLSKGVRREARHAATTTQEGIDE